MSSTNTEILNWQDFIFGWSFTCGGEDPPEGLAENVFVSSELNRSGIASSAWSDTAETQ